MASSDITALFFDQEEIPMALLFGPETIVPGRRCAISSLGGNFDRVQALEALRTLFPSNLQVIVWKSTSNEPISLESMTFEEMETAVAFKARGEACNIAGESQLEYDNLKAQYLSAINESERVGVLQAMKNLLHTAVLQNLAANALKSFETFTDTSTELAMCLLDFRKLFTTDQSKVQPIQNRINRAIARAALPRVQDDAKPSAKSSDDAKLSEDPVPAQASAKNANPDRAPSGRLRKKITEPSSSSSSEDPASSSEVEYPVAGCHTDTEQENLSDGLSTPIVIRTVPAPSFESQPKEIFQPIPSQSYHTIPKKKKTKKSKKDKKSERSQPKKTRVSHKKNKKHKAKKSRRVSPPPASSTSSEESGSDSEDNFQAPVPADQVLALEA